MESVKKTIEKYGLLKKGDTIAVAVSGGSDSMALLHFLNQNKKNYGIEVVAINVDHCIRETSKNDSDFVENWCKENGIVCYRFKVDVPSLIKDLKQGIEETARFARYKIFDGVVKKGLADKVAIAHHQSDQAETILLNIFRGSGLKGASGMDVKQGIYIRPFLNTTKNEILQYVKKNNIDFVTDETNADINYSRNFIRNQIMPSLKSRWKNVETNIINFANICKLDNEYIDSTISFDDILFDANEVRIPLYKFVNSVAVQNRILRYAFSKLGKSKDIESRHLTILRNLVKSGENGSKISLPNKLKASLDYDELTISVQRDDKIFIPKDFKVGLTKFDNCTIKIRKTAKFNEKDMNFHTIDAKLLPKDAKWRTRQNGDVFTKFGSGEKKLKDYFIDKKIPNSKRGQIPVLASGSEIYCVLGYEISDKVKVGEQTKQAYVIEILKPKA